MDPESVTLGASLRPPRGKVVVGRSFFFNENPRVKLRLAARGRTRGPKVTLKWPKVTQSGSKVTQSDPKVDQSHPKWLQSDPK